MGMSRRDRLVAKYTEEAKRLMSASGNPHRLFKIAAEKGRVNEPAGPMAGARGDQVLCDQEIPQEASPGSEA